MQKLKRIFLLSLLISGCAGNQALIDLAEVQGAYPVQVKKEDWALTPWGFYLNRDLSLDGETLNYQALYDNTALKKSLQKDYTTTDRFNKKFPNFIHHQGVVDCNKNTSKSSYTTYLSFPDKPIKTFYSTQMTEPATAVCVLYRANHEK